MALRGGDEVEHRLQLLALRIQHLAGGGVGEGSDAPLLHSNLQKGVRFC